METDVLIVGGGLSGLSITDHLTRAGADFLLVEAQDRLGGRILTKEIAGGHFDMGPAWFWPGQVRVADLAKRFELSVFEQYSTGDIVYQDQNGAIQRGRGFASMQGSLRVDGGMGSLISALAGVVDRNRIHLGTSLRSLSLQDERIIGTLDASGSRIDITAKQVVLAIPPRVAAARLDFHPELGAATMEVMSAIPTWMAGHAKIMAVYDKAYWRDAGFSGDAMSQYGPMVEIHDASPIEGGPYAVFGFVGVPPDTRMARKDEVLRLALSQLTQMFGAAMAQPLDIVSQDWVEIPEIATPNDKAPLRNHPEYGLPTELRGLWNNRMFLASTEVGQAFGGYVEGALEAAEMTMQQLRPHISNST